MRKVDLRMNEQQKYKVIKQLADHPEGNKKRAALELGCTQRHVNRMLQGYKQEGKVFFQHGNRGRKPIGTIDCHTKATIVDLYKNKYHDSNFTHFTELLERHEGINIAPSTVANILENEFILSPKVTKEKRKRFKKKLKALEANAKTKKEVKTIQTNLVAVEDAHPRRPRRAYFGELIQMDASSFDWVPGHNWHLHLAIDDNTGRIVGAYFDTQETLKGYYNIFHQILTTYGIPYQFLTDRRTVFEYKHKKSPSSDEDTYTQFAYACKQLGTKLEATSVPQAKGRVERLNGTLQSRLPIELRLANITTIESANEFLNSYIKEFNERFALPIDYSKSVFEEQPTDEKINLILAVLSERVVDGGNSIKYKNDFYRMLDKDSEHVHYRKGTKVLVIEAFDQNIYCSVNDKIVHALEVIPEYELQSKEIDLVTDADKVVKKKKTKNIPAPNHAWRVAGIQKFRQSQVHRKDDVA